MKPLFVLLEACNFTDHPVGGQLNYARLLLSLYQNRIATVGYTMDADEPVGEWFEKDAGGFCRMHFNLWRLDSHSNNYRFPRRLLVLFYCLKNWGKIKELGCRRLYLQEHAALIAVRRRDWDSICYRFPGVESQLSKSRFAWAKPLSRLFDFFFYRATRKADVLLASADHKAIEQMRAESFGFVKNREVVWFPTRVDTSVFYPEPSCEPEICEQVHFVSSGRLHWVKGWDLVLDSLALLKESVSFTYIYIGDGPDRQALLDKAKAVGLQDRVDVTGFLQPDEMAGRLRDADIYLMGSHMEGWPTTLVEAYVSGLPMICTDVSGADTIISEGENGFVCRNRNPLDFSGLIKKSLELDAESVAGMVDSSLYSVETLQSDLSRAWGI